MKTTLYFLSSAGSHIAYEFPPVGPAICVKAAEFINSCGIEFSVHQNPMPGWVVCTEAEYQAIKARALAALGLVSSTVEDALFMEMCDAFDAQQAAHLPV